MNVTTKHASKYEIKFIHGQIDQYLCEDNYVVVIDKNVHQLHKQYLSNVLKNAKATLIIEMIEENKSLNTLVMILDFYQQNNIDKTTTVVAIGGGVCGDITGLSCSLYMRGLKLINVATTLLSQVDSSIGSKVALNYAGVKNLVGTFYDPSFVIIDTVFLTTLSERVFNEGMVEIIKHGLIANEKIINMLLECSSEQLRDPQIITKLIRQALEVKKKFVEQDYFDTSTRHFLNYGHTLAHIIEIDERNDLYHGEALAIGMLVSSYLSSKEIYETTLKVLEKFSVVKFFKLKNFDNLLFDKKRQKGVITEIFLSKVGSAYLKKINIEQLEQMYKETISKIFNSRFQISAKNLVGKVTIDASKSYLHRYIIMSLITQTNITLNNVGELAQDVIITLEICQKFGLDYVHNNTQLKLNVKQKKHDYVSVNVGQSASSLRMMLPCLCLLTKEIEFKAEGNLLKRPLNIYERIFQQVQFFSDKKTVLKLKITSDIEQKHFSIEGNVSSRFLSGLLFYGVCLGQQITIKITTPLESEAYLLMTLKVLKQFGYETEYDKIQNIVVLNTKKKVVSCSVFNVEQDYSTRSYYEVMNLFGASIELQKRDKDSLQPCFQVFDKLEKQSLHEDLSQIIDSVPILSIVATKRGGRFDNIARLKIKECDRLKAITSFLEKMQINYKIVNESIIITQGNIRANMHNTYNDHRILMSLVVSSIISDPIYVNEISSCNKSAPNFIKDFITLGGKVDEEFFW